MLACKNNFTHLKLADMLSRHEIVREYRALVYGFVKEDKGMIDAPIGRSTNDRRKMAVNKDGKSAVTHFEVVERLGDITDLKLILETGRTHQIRVHMAYIGHPVVGDPVYAARRKNYGLAGQALHSRAITFVHPRRIEEMAGKARKELNQTIKTEGEKAAFDTGVMNLHPELIKLLGRLRYRTSYGQNVLQHSIEVSWIAAMMADELGLDSNLARRGGLLHDIGKAVDFEQEGTHIQLGVEIAKKYHESPAVINCIEAHHGDVEPLSAEAVLVAAADAISAARPGARRENLETYIKRIEKLEEIATSFEGVEKSFAIQAGREIRVIVSPDKVSDDEMTLKARDICKKIEDELDYPGQIKVNVIRETRATDVAK